MLFIRYREDGSSESAILSCGADRINYYFIEAGWYYDSNSIRDYDGQPGAEVVLTNGQGLYKAICDARGVISE